MKQLLTRLIWPAHLWLAANLKAATDDNEVVVKTSRYLRLSMIGLVIGLGASLVFELLRVKNKDGEFCLLGSISAYYYTPVHAFFVGTLVTIGICLIALKGNTHFEDLLLNFAGVLAPLVALVPINPAPKDCSATLGATDRDLNIANNVGALLIVGFIALALFGVLRIVDLLKSDQSKKPHLMDYISYFGALLLFVVSLISFWRYRTGFMEHAHKFSAIAMFAFIGVNVLVNGYNLYQTREHPAPGSPPRRKVRGLNRYVNLGMLMALAAVLFPTVIRPGWDQWVFGLEATEIGLFAIFWGLQSIELWDQGLRPKVKEAALPVQRGSTGEAVSNSH